MDINKIAERYGLASLEIFQENGEEVEFYKSLLILTDHITSKILEGVSTSADYADELYYQKIDGNVYSPEEYPAGWEKV